MANQNEQIEFIAQIRRLRKEVAGESLTLREFVDILGQNSHNILILLFCLPFLQPLPMMGLSTILGGLMAIIAGAQVFGIPAWIPQRWENKAFPKELMEKILEVGERLAIRLSRWRAPSLAILTSRTFVWLNGGIVILSAILLALPLPIPFSNTVPAIVIFIHSLGRLEKNGALILVSYILFALCLAFFVLLGLGVEAGIGLLK